MKRKRAACRLATLAIALASLGCGDSPTKPDPKLNVLRIQVSALSFEEQTIGVGDTIQLTAHLYDPAGTEISATGFDWSSTQAEVASVSTSGKVTGIAVGTTLVIAAADGHADTARINVALPLTSPIACAAGESGLNLAVGEIYETTGDQASSLCIQTGPEGGEYALIPFNASEAPNGTMPVEVTGTGINRFVFGPPTPNRIPSSTSVARPSLARDDAFHMRMLKGSQRALEPRLRTASRRGLSPVAPRLASAPAAGSFMDLNVEVDSGSGCADPDFRTGRVVAVTDKAIVVVDTANPKTGLSAAAETDLYRSFGVAFDTLVWPMDTRNFGEPSDIDKNGKVIVFFTKAVNEQTPRTNNDSYVGGYFYNRDLFSPTGKDACEGSNHREMFYMLSPDPTGSVNGHTRSVSFIRNSSVGVLAHEFQHLINDSRRLYVNAAPVWEESWLNEGLSHIAEELAFYESSGLRPRQNIGPTSLSSSAAASAFGEFQGSNIDRYIRFLQAPETNTLMGPDDLPTRGAIWAFLRYVADRDAGSDTTLWNRLVRDTKTQGLANLQQALGANPREWIEDWAVSVYTDDAGLALDDPARHTQPSWNFRTLLPQVRTNSIPLGKFPLRTLSMTAGEARKLSLRGGGMAYLRFGVQAGQSAAVRATVKGLPAPSLLKLAVVRTR
jgi:hypothetical protein